MSNLSPQQQHILRWLLERTRQAELHDSNSTSSGIWWAPEVKDKERESCRRASLCRALARLEKRELIRRIKGRKQTRTVRVLLTEEGRWVDEVLAGY
jgi:DNA-binding MarR family transcriptional regulator